MAQLDYSSVFAARSGTLAEVRQAEPAARSDRHATSAINGLILGPLFLLAGARGMKSPAFRREVRAAMFGIGLSNVLGFAAEAAASTIRR